MQSVRRRRGEENQGSLEAPRAGNSALGCALRAPTASFGSRSVTSRARGPPQPCLPLGFTAKPLPGAPHLESSHQSIAHPYEIPPSDSGDPEGLHKPEFLTCIKEQMYQKYQNSPRSLSHPPRFGWRHPTGLTASAPTQAVSRGAPRHFPAPSPPELSSCSPPRERGEAQPF